jgi:putative NADH-flavin reductase
MTLDGRVMVLGGYGTVGGTVTRELSRTFPGRVVCVGRHLAQAEQLAADTPGVIPAQADITAPETVLDLAADLDVVVVVLAVEPSDSSFMRACLERSLTVVDMSASAHLLVQAGALHDLAVDTGGSAILSVGVAPGLTNILARRLKESLGSLDEVDITVLLGTGERHGREAVTWTVRQLTAPVDRRAQPARRRVHVPTYGRRSAYVFPFSDQVTLKATLGVRTAATRLCFDSPVLTNLVFAMQRVGILRLFAGARGQEFLCLIFQCVHSGGSGFALHVEAGNGVSRRWIAITGDEQSRVTARVTACVAGYALAGVRPGVHHMEEIDDLGAVPEKLAAIGVQVWTDSGGLDPRGTDRLERSASDRR